MHAPLLIALGHLLVENTATGSHPLHVASGHFAFVTQAVSVLDRASKHISDGLDAAMRMPGKTRNVIFGMLITKIIQQQEGIEILGLADRIPRFARNDKAFIDFYDARPANGSNAMLRACLMAVASRCWCGEQTPVNRRGTILPLSATNCPSRR